MSNLQEDLVTICDEEEKKYLEALEKGEEEYEKKDFEILEGEIREVLKNEGTLVRENPLNFPPTVQRKYFGASAEDWRFPENVDTESIEIQEWQYVISYIVKNPYTGEERTLYKIRDREAQHKLSKKEIGDKIVLEAFDNNEHAQTADLTAGLLGIAYLLVQIVGKEAVNQAIGHLRPSLEAASDVREQVGLSRYDLSFLE